MGERHGLSIIDVALAAGESLRWVHRIDKVTSGVLLLAKTQDSHSVLTRQFAKRTVDKAYLAWIAGENIPVQGQIDLPLTQGRKGRIRVAGNRQEIRYEASANLFTLDRGSVYTDRPIYDSCTKYDVIAKQDGTSLLLLNPVTGRRHQIRVHLAWIGFPILGDPLFCAATSTRTYLHSWTLAVDCPWFADASRRTFVANPDNEFLRAADEKVLELARNVAEESPYFSSRGSLSS